MEKWVIRPPLPQKPLSRLSPKFSWVITSAIPTLRKISSRYDYPFSLPQICENAHEVTRLVFWFFCRHTVAKTSASIFTISASNDVVSHKGPRKQNFTFRPHFPQNGHFGPFFDGTSEISPHKGSIMGLLRCKLPLIVFLAT